MEDRIKIGDVWYVREEKTTPTQPKEELEIILSREVLIENDHVLVVGSVLENETKVEPGVLMVEENKFCMPSLDITFKNSDRDTECWDNDSFLAGLAIRDDDSMKEMSDIDDKVKEVVLAVVDKMRELKYI
jgi:hypothetical protein